MPNSVIGKFNNIVGGGTTVSRNEASMARKLHSLNTKKIVFGKAKQTHIKNIRLDRDNKRMQFDKVGDRNHSLGWDIHHIDLNPRNDSINNYEAVNYVTHKRIHDEN